MAESSSAQPKKPVEVFIAYSHEDYTYLKEFEQHLRGLELEDQIVVWHSRKIGPGEDWKKQIDQHLDLDPLILLLISPSFVNSGYCIEKEAKRAMERHKAGKARVIPIILRKTDWEHIPFGELSLGDLQALPTGAEAIVDNPHWDSRDEAFSDVVKGIRGILPYLPPQPEPVNSSTVARGGLPRRNLLFTGREKELASLHNELQKHRKVALAQSHLVSSIGGSGKTQVAIEYAYRYRNTYSEVLWVRADSHDMLHESLRGVRRRLTRKDNQDSVLTVLHLRSWLRANSDWLLILDNAYSLDIINQIVPDESRGYILLTTLEQDTIDFPKVVIGNMEEEDGVLLLLKRADLLHLIQEKETPEAVSQETVSEEDLPRVKADLARVEEQLARAKEISHLLRGHSLALNQAGAYMAKTGCGLDGFLQIYKGNRSGLLGDRGNLYFEHPQSVSSSSHRNSVVTTLSLLIQRVEKEEGNHAAIAMLNFCALFPSDTISEKFITAGAQYFGPDLQAVATREPNLNLAFEALMKFSLIRRHDKKVFINGLVQAVLRDRMSEDEQYLWAQRRFMVITHVLSYAEAAEDYEDALSQKVLEYDPSLKVLYLNNLAEIYRIQGRYEAAREKLKEAEEICRNELKKTRMASLS